MDNRRNNQKSPTGETVFPAVRILALLNGLRANLGGNDGCPATFDALERMTGRPVNTLVDWFGGGITLQIAALLSMMERLPPEIRHKLLDDACRISPSIRDARIAHDFHAVESLSKLAEKSRGLTLVHGQSGHLRSFVMAALANAVARTDAAGLSGLDIHSAAECAPLPGVAYLNRSIPQPDVQAVIRGAWSRIKSGTSRCIVLNGIINRAPDLMPEVIDWSTRAHVILADNIQPRTGRLLYGDKWQNHSVMVSPGRQHPTSIAIEIQEI